VSFSLHRRLYAACSDYLSGLDQPIRRTGFQLPIALDPFCGMQGSEDRDVPLMAPSLHLGALYAVEQGGSVPQLFTGPRSGYLFSPRAAPPEKRGYTIPAAEKYWPILSSEAFRVDAEFRRHVLTDLAQHGRTYEAIVVFGATAPDVDTLERFGYVPEWRKGGLYIGAFRAE